MGFEAGEEKVYNPQKQISTEIVLDALIRHRDAIRQARTGEKNGIDMLKVTDNERRLNQVQALSLIISSQRDMITISRPIIRNNEYRKYLKSMNTEDKQKETSFDIWDSDFKKILNWLDFLKFCFESISDADKTKSKEDDFLRERITSNGESFMELTNNFFDMLDDLEESYEGIYSLMMKHKIVSAGMEEDDEATEKELEQEAIRRITEA